MRLSIWNQFSSNHSSSYLIVGRFNAVDKATQAQNTLHDIFTEINEWFERPENEPFTHYGWSDPPTPIEAELIRKYNLETDNTMGLGGDDVRHSLSVQATDNLVHLYIDETTGLDEHYPLGDLMLRMGAEHVIRAFAVDGNEQVQYHLTCLISNETDCQTKIMDYLGDEYPEEEMDRFEIIVEAQRLSLHLRLDVTQVAENIPALHDILQSCGCTDIRWEVKEG
jgi:hypothetical protein